jgi:hypothetical protein
MFTAPSERDVSWGPSYKHLAALRPGEQPQLETTHYYPTTHPTTQSRHRLQKSS